MKSFRILATKAFKTLKKTKFQLMSKIFNAAKIEKNIEKNNLYVHIGNKRFFFHF